MRDRRGRMCCSCMRFPTRWTYAASFPDNFQTKVLNRSFFPRFPRPDSALWSLQSNPQSGLRTSPIYSVWIMGWWEVQEVNGVAPSWEEVDLLRLWCDGRLLIGNNFVPPSQNLTWILYDSISFNILLHAKGLSVFFGAPQMTISGSLGSSLFSPNKTVTTIKWRQQ